MIRFVCRPIIVYNVICLLWNQCILELIKVSNIVGFVAGIPAIKYTDYKGNRSLDRDRAHKRDYGKALSYLAFIGVHLWTFHSKEGLCIPYFKA